MRRTPGYTLLEMMVVLAVLALATSLVAPASFRQLESWRRHAQAMDLLKAIATLPTAAREGAQMLVIPAGRYLGEFGGLPVPDGWTVLLDSELRVLATGACLGSTGSLSQGGFLQAFALDAPYCRVRRVEAPT